MADYASLTRAPARALLAIALFLACDSEEPAEEPPINLPPRDAGDPVDAAADTIVEPVVDAGPDVEAPIDPCAASNLVACFPFEESVSDTKGNLVNAEVTNVTFVEGKKDKGASLAPGSKIRFTATDKLATPAATVDAWIKLLPTFNAEATVYEVDERHVMTIEADRTLLCASPGGADRGLQVTLDKWVHVACVFGGGNALAYVDGNPSGTSPFTSFPAAAPVVAEIGNDTPDGTRPFIGAIDSLRIFSVVRTPAEIKEAAK